MPIYEYRCMECGNESEHIVFGGSEDVKCPECGASSMEKIMSPTSSLTGATPQAMPGPGDTGCCGSRPGEASGCAGPGSCCGRA